MALQQRQNIISLSLVIGAALLVRFIVALHPYSGAGVSPQYGDYEAQRHWMELAVNLPVSDWYMQSANNNLTYWGLDYPPLSGYQVKLEVELVKVNILCLARQLNPD